MALMFADVGCDLVLGTFFNNSPATQNLLLKLFTNNVTPADTDTTGSYTEATGGNYSAKTLTNGGWTITVGNDPSDAVYPQQTFTFNGPLTANATVYGYFVTNAAGTVLMWSERLSAAFTPANNGDQILITPRVQMSKGTPS